MDLPTYTNIWRIEKRLYKLYDFRLPAPLPITWIGVFVGITVPYVFFLVVIGVPFNHNLLWLYVLPPAVLTWLTTRPVIESKRLPELVGSQLRYLAEPRTWCRMAPLAEKDDIVLSARVWHSRPRQRDRARQATAAPGNAVAQAVAPPAAELPAAAWQAAPPPEPAPASEAVPLPVPQRAMSQSSRADRGQDDRALEVSHDPGPAAGGLGASWPVPSVPASWPSAAFRGTTASPGVGPFPGTGPFAELEPLPDPDPVAAAPQAGAAAATAPPATLSVAATAPPAGGAGTTGRSVVARVAAMFIDLDGDRSVPSAERAISGPGRQGDADWGRRVNVVTGGHGRSMRDREAMDRDRARLPLAGSRRIAVLGCTSGAGQSVTVLMTGRILAAVRGIPVAAVDLNAGERALAARIAPVTSVTALLAESERDGDDPAASAAGPALGQARTRRTGREPGARLDMIAAGSPGGDGGRALESDDYRRLAALLAARYPLIVIDPAPSGLTRVLGMADQLVLVAPANADAANSLANTQQWLNAHGYGGLAARAVTVVNGVSQRASEDVLRVESVARGRCRAIVRVPSDDLLSVRPDTQAVWSPQTRRAYTALAGVLVAALSPGTASPVTASPGRSAGERSH